MTISGYAVSRDKRGLTGRERAVMHGLIEGRSQIELAADLGVSKQRVQQLVKALEHKGVLFSLDGQQFMKVKVTI